MLHIFTICCKRRIVSIIGYQFRVSRRCISRIIPTVAKAIIDELQHQYLKTPNRVDEWLIISEKFYQRWNFPNMIGAVDGKQIVLEQPNKSGSHNRNYKGTDSILLMAVVGPEYQFLFADVGMNGRNSDGGKWSQSPMKKALENGTLNLPKSKSLSADSRDIPYVCVGDDAFPLTTYMMKSYPQKDLSPDKKFLTTDCLALDKFLKMLLAYLLIVGAYFESHLHGSQKKLKSLHFQYSSSTIG